MNTLQNLIWNVGEAVRFIWQLVRYALAFLLALFQRRATLAARLLAAQSQLAVCKHRIQGKKDPRPRFTAAFRILWVILSKSLQAWQDWAHVMQPATVTRWHRTAFRLSWRWRSRGKPGRPPICDEMQDLIRKLSQENPLWSAERIRDTLLLLQFDPPCEDTIRKYMVKPNKTRERSMTWFPFLRNHLDVSWAIDFFTVPTVSFSILYVFVVFDHGRRKVIHWATTRHPYMDWVIQQLREATPFGHQPRYLFRDNDSIYGYGVRAFLDRCGIEEVCIAHRSPWQNPFIERFIGTLRRELLDHVIVLSQSHLDRLLREYIDDYYHVARPHQGLDGDTPIPQEKRPPVVEPTKLKSMPILGGLHHRYARMAA